MTRDQRKLLKALQQRHRSPLQVKMATIILFCCGIEEAKKYVGDLDNQIQRPVPIEAAESEYLDRLMQDTFWPEVAGAEAA